MGWVERLSLAPGWNGAIQTMFDSKEDALEHRDSVMDVLVKETGFSTWHIHPVLDGAVVRIEESNLDETESEMQNAGFTVDKMGKSGEWTEIKVKP